MKNIRFFIVIPINICIFALSLKTIDHETQNKGVAKKGERTQLLPPALQRDPDEG